MINIKRTEKSGRFLNMTKYAIFDLWGIISQFYTVNLFSDIVQIAESLLN